MSVSLMTVAERATDTFLLQQEKVFRGAPLFPQNMPPQIRISFRRSLYLISPDLHLFAHCTTATQIYIGNTDFLLQKPKSGFNTDRLPWGNPEYVQTSAGHNPFSF